MLWTTFAILIILWLLGCGFQVARALLHLLDVLGKTGTCSKDGTCFGWFASYANTDRGGIATGVFLQDERPTYGPKAAEIAGRMYRNLYDHSFFTAAAHPSTSSAPTATQVSQ